MSIIEEITRIKNNIANAYVECERLDADIPEDKNSDNLSSTICTIKKCCNPICLEPVEEPKGPDFQDVNINFTQKNGTLTNNVFKGCASAYLTINERINLSICNSWEFKTKYTYKSSFGHATILSGSSDRDFMFPRLVFDGEQNALKFYLSSNGNSWDINESDSNLIPNGGTTYFIRAGYDGEKYYIYYNTSGWNNDFIEAFVLESDKKVLCSDEVMLMNSGTDVTRYYSSGLIDLTDTNFIMQSANILKF